MPDPFDEFDRLTAASTPSRPRDPFAEFDNLLGQPRSVEQSAQSRLLEMSAVAAAQEDQGFSTTEEPEQRLIRFNQIRARFGLRDVQELPSELQPVGLVEELGKQWTTTRGLGEKVPFVGDFAVTGYDAATLLPAAHRIEKNEGTDEDYEAVLGYLQRQVEARRPRTFMGSVAGIASEMPTYAAEFASTFGTGTVARKVAGKALAKTVSEGLGKAVTKALEKRGLKKLTDVAAQVAVLTAVKAPMQALQRTFPEVRLRGDQEVLVIPGESTKQAIVNAGFDTAIEVLSERSGEAMLAIGKFKPLGKLGKAARDKLGIPELSIKAKDFFARVGFQGPIVESLEERGGEAMRQAVTELGWAQLPQQLPTGKQIGAELLAFTLPSAAAHGMSAAQRRIVSDYRQRQAAGQQDPAPSAQVFKDAGYPDMNRAERLDESRMLDAQATREEAEETSGYAMASQGEEWTEEFPVTSGDATGNVKFLQQIDALEMPEMFHLASTLLGQDPTVRRLSKFEKGKFKPRERALQLMREDGYTDAAAREQAEAEREGRYGDIIIDPSTASSEPMLARTFGHELGHAVDYLPDLTMARGNILGRLASLRNYLKKTLDTKKTKLTSQELSELYDEAREKAQGEGPFEQTVDLYIERNLGVTPKDVVAIWNAVADAPINKDLEKYIAKLSTADKKKIVSQALKGRLPEEVQSFTKKVREPTGRQFTISGQPTARIKEIYENLVHDEIKKRKLTKEDIRFELIALSEWWKPYNVKNADKKYITYRRSSRELYADALSVFFNTPGELQKRAPLFYNSFMDFLDRKPEVLDEYIKLQETLAGGTDAVAEQRSNWVSKMFTRARDRVIAGNAAAKARQQSVKESVGQKLEALFVDDQIPAIRRAQRGMTDKDFKEQVDSQNIEYLMSALQRTTGPAQAIVNATTNVQQRLHRAGVTNDDIEEYLFYLNVADRRRGKVSPLGFTPKTAQDQLDYLRRRMGPEKYDMMDRELRQWHLDTAMPVAEESVEVGNFSQQTFDQDIKPNAETYATFAVARHIAKDGGKIAPGVYETVGTFEDILDPLQATTLKLISMKLANMSNRARTEMVNQMVRTGDMNGKPQRVTKYQRLKKPDPGFDWLYYRQNGELYAAQVPKQVADVFSYSDLGRLEWLGSAFRTGFYKLFHPLFISYSPGFTAVNPFRDTLRTWRDMSNIAFKYRKQEIERLQKEEGLTKAEAKRRTAPMKITYADVWREWMRARAHAKDVIDGVTDNETVNRVLASGALDVSYVSAAAESQDRPVLDPRHLRFPGMEEEKPPIHERIKKSGIPGAKLVGGLMELVYRENMIQEAAGRIGGFELAGRFAKEDTTRGFFAVKHSGTPDYRQRGNLTFLTNSLFPYSRVRWNDYQRQYRLLKDKDTRWGFLLRSIGVHLPSLALERAAMLGLLGYGAKKMYELMPSVWLENFFCIPVGVTAPSGDGDDEQAVVITLPLDDTYTAWTRLARTLMEHESFGTVMKELVDLAQDMFAPSFNPAVSIPLKWAEFAAGRNPWDPFRDRPIIPRGDFEAGGWYKGRKMVAWTLDQFGVLSTLTYPATAAMSGRAFEPGTDSSTEVFLNTATRATGAGRFVRWSGAGASESDWAEIEAMDQESAALRRSYSGLVQRLRTERWRLMKLQDTLDAPKRTRLQRLKSWYSAVYLPRARAASLAQERGNTQLAQQIIADVDTITMRWFEGNQ